MASLHQPKEPQNLGQSASRNQESLKTVTPRSSDHQQVDPLPHVFRIERPRAPGLCPSRSPASHTQPKRKERKAQASISRRPFLADLGQLPEALPVYLLLVLFSR